MKKCFYSVLTVFGFCLFFFSCKKESNQNPSAAPLDFTAYKSDFLDNYWRLHPLHATTVGYHEFDSQLPEPSRKNREQVVSWSQQQLNELKKYVLDSLNQLDRVDYELIKNTLESSIWYAEQYKAFEWDPASYNLGTVFFYTLKSDKPLNERLVHVADRLRLVPDYYKRAKENIAFPVEERLDLAINQIPASLDIIEEAVLDSLKMATLPEADVATLRQEVQNAVTAINDFEAYLKDLKAKTNTYRTFRIGDELYNRKFDLDINSGFSAKENYEFALQAKSEVHARMKKLADKLWPKYFPNTQPPEDLELIAKLIEKISQAHTTKTQFVDEVKRQIPELVDFVTAHDLIYLDPSKPLVVRETPTYMRGFAGASISAPGPYDKQANTYYNVTPIDDWSDEDANSYLEEYNDYMLQILNIHEAIPGHYTQLVYANENPSLIKSIFGNGAMIEGWACFAERMMLENGYGAGPTRDELLLMYYKWNLRIIANSIIDYGIHVKNWSEEQVMHLLVDECFQEQAEAQGKWKRARLSAVQLTSYFNGLTEIQQLKDDIEAKQGSAFNIKAFNEQFLSYGSAPVRLIRELMLEQDVE